ncbi:PspC domain-containing protein [Phytomonospora endophytica]|uniref:PspC domain-containing protein n=1 Tax=Phytomonospora endophytica TaxID=714109 RepID=UPI001EF265E8|nr:PspC domain-containing protein [Phytomonospora endophytica]
MDTDRKGAPPDENLTRPTQGRVIAGVCAALAERFGTTPTTMRVLTIASLLLPGTQVLIYLALWILIPSEDKQTTTVTA